MWYSLQKQTLSSPPLVGVRPGGEDSLLSQTIRGTANIRFQVLNARIIFESNWRAPLKVIHVFLYKKVGVLPIRIVWSNVSSIGPSSARNVRLYYPYWQYTDLFIFRFVSLLCLCSTLRLKCYSGGLGGVTLSVIVYFDWSEDWSPPRAHQSLLKKWGTFLLFYGFSLGSRLVLEVASTPAPTNFCFFYKLRGNFNKHQKTPKWIMPPMKVLL